ncbi:hypothetical protein BD779DRAFT_1571395 [Infundibulicybe gibba]|nr:hypothetical protein BD779DRAFT_1571395 [Infundibulicybe gibba]
MENDLGTLGEPGVYLNVSITLDSPHPLDMTQLFRLALLFSALVMTAALPYPNHVELHVGCLVNNVARQAGPAPSNTPGLGWTTLGSLLGGIGNTVGQTGSAVGGTASQAGGVVGNTVSQAGAVVGSTASQAGAAAGSTICFASALSLLLGKNPCGGSR